MQFKGISYLELWQPFYSSEHIHLCNFGRELSVLSVWVYLGGSSTKQPVKCLFALIFFIPVGSGRFLIVLFYTSFGLLFWDTTQ